MEGRRHLRRFLDAVAAIETRMELEAAEADLAQLHTRAALLNITLG